MRGYKIYIREGCKYCHTQQTRTLVSDVIRSGWKGVHSPVSTPDEFVYDYRQTFGTKRTGPDLSRIGGKYNKQWHQRALPQSARPGARVHHAAVSVDRQQPAGIRRAGGLPANSRPRQGLAPG